MTDSVKRGDCAAIDSVAIPAVSTEIVASAESRASYFAEQYAQLTYPIAEDGARGFRPAQRAALEAINHNLYSRPDAPVIVVMPTGSGKTIVMNAVAFTQRARRVLVLTPSRLVREQIAEGFETLEDLKEIRAIPPTMRGPKVFCTKGRVGTDAAWESLRGYDVVVATVPSVSPKADLIPEPPADLFDLILVDEAHHVAAATWKALLDCFPNVRRVHFTATPFRNDEREIEGRLVFVYDIRRAHDDRIFGDIIYEPVTPALGADPDVAIARAAEARLRSDQAAGLRHLLMVRTDSRKRADELKKLYEEHTGLNLRLVAGNQSLRHVKGVIEELRTFKLDGVICVNMLAEGFNLPNLKVAAIHAPHRSLAVTLQFVGRFARTAGAHLGRATFLAIPSDIRIETTKLFRQDAVWRDIVQNLSATRVAEEVRVREYLDGFAKTASPDLADFSLYAVRPYYHVKILAVPEGVDLGREAEFPWNLTSIYRGHSEEHDSVVYITRETWRSPWSDDDRLENVVFDIFLLHYHRGAGLLFICASRRHASIYDRLARSVALGKARPLSLSRLNRVLNDLEGMELFNLGMRNRSTFGNAESYRTLAGPAADKAVQPSDGRMFDRGHCFGRATEAGETVTIGLSSASKVWSNTSGAIPELIEWCDRLAARIASGRTPMTKCGIDHLSAGEELTDIPEGVLVACWGRNVYLDPPQIRFEQADGATVAANLLDLELRVEASGAGGIRVSLSNEDVRYEAVFAIDADNYFAPASADEPDIIVVQGRSETPLIDFLNDMPLSFYTADLSRIEGHSLYRTPEDLVPFDVAMFDTVDWAAGNVAIEVEKPPAPDGKRSIFEWLEEHLAASAAVVVYSDDGAGEMADYITMRAIDDYTVVTLYHCKGSAGRRPGDRVDDAYEVCGQAVKSMVWTRERVMLGRLAKRLTRRHPSQYLKGDHVTAEALLGDARVRAVRFEIVVVQPGFRRGGLSARVASLLAAASDYLVRGNVLPLRVIGSA